MLRALLAGVVVALAALVLPVHASSGLGDAPRIDAAAWYLVGDDGRVLAEGDSRRPRAIASITKLMTTLVALEHAGPSDVVRVSPAVGAIGGSTIFLQGGEELSVAELVRATLIPSANDAATALALHVGRGLDRPLRRAHEPEGAGARPGGHDVHQPARPRPAGSPVERARRDNPAPARVRHPAAP